MFGNQEEDDFGPVSSGSSKLASLFGGETSRDKSANQSLSYSAPKQPKPAMPPSNQTQLLLPTSVTAYKIIDGQYQSQGRLNAALVANMAKADYRIIVYQGSDKQIAQAGVHEASQISLSRSQYLSLLDAQNQYWSLLFDSSSVAHAFLRQLAILRHLQQQSAGSQQSSVVKFDLSVGEGPELGPEDSAEVRYTAWLLGPDGLRCSPESLTSNETSSEGNSGPPPALRFRLGRGRSASTTSSTSSTVVAVPGWDVGLPGMRRGGRRLLVVPPSLAYGAAGNSSSGFVVPPNAALVYAVELLRLKAQQPQQPPAVVAPPPVVDAKPGRSLSSSSNSGLGGGAEDSEKSRLLSRMARMGQAVMPSAAAAAAGPDGDMMLDNTDDGNDGEADSSAAEDARAPPPPKQQKQKQKQQKQQHQQQPPLPQHLQQQQQFMQAPYPPQAYPPAYPGMLNPAVSASMGLMGGPYQQMQYQQHQQQHHQQMTSLAGGAMLPYTPPATVMTHLSQHQMAPGPAAPAAAAAAAAEPQPSGVTGLLVSETRQHNTEMRLSVARVQDQLDRLSDKVQAIAEADRDRHQLQVAAPTLEASVLFASIGRIVRDNEAIRQEVTEKSAKIQELNDKISSLVRRSQDTHEHSNSLLERNADALQTSAAQSAKRVLDLEQEKLDLTTRLSERTAQLSQQQQLTTQLEAAERQLKEQLAATLGRTETNDTAVLQLRARLGEAETRCQQAEAALKDERRVRLAGEESAREAEEAMKEMREKLDRSGAQLQDWRAKLTAERRQFESDLASVRASADAAEAQLRDQLRLCRTSTDKDFAQRAADIEAEAERAWRDKCDHLVALERERGARLAGDLEAERAKLAGQVEESARRLAEARAVGHQRQEALDEAREQLEDAQAKLEKTRGQAMKLKQRLEQQLLEVAAERDSLQARLDEGGAGAADISAELKVVMNGVFQSLRRKINRDKKYNGSTVLQTLLLVIKKQTLRATGDLTADAAESSDEEAEEASSGNNNERDEASSEEADSGDDASDAENDADADDREVAAASAAGASAVISVEPSTPPTSPGEHSHSELVVGAAQKLHRQEISARLSALSPSGGASGAGGGEVAAAAADPAEFHPVPSRGPCTPPGTPEHQHQQRQQHQQQQHGAATPPAAAAAQAAAPQAAAGLAPPVPPLPAAGAGLEDSGAFDEFDSKVRSPEDRAHLQEEVVLEDDGAAPEAEQDDEEEIPAEDGGIQAEAREIPAEDGGIPAEAREIPAEDGGIPAEAREIPSADGGIPTEKREIPTESGGIPTEERKIPTESGEISSDTREILSDSEETTPSETEEIPPKTEAAPEPKEEDESASSEVDTAGDDKKEKILQEPPQEQQLNQQKQPEEPVDVLGAAPKPPSTVPKLKDIFSDSDSDEENIVGSQPKPSQPVAPATAAAVKSKDIFGDDAADSDEDEDSQFGKALFKSKEEEAAEAEKAKAAAAAVAKTQQQPPPLFSDDDDDDNMDWLK